MRIDALGWEGAPVNVPICLLKSMSFLLTAKNQAVLGESAAFLLTIQQEITPPLAPVLPGQGILIQMQATE